MGVEAGDLFVGFAAGLDEGLATLDCDFLKGFQAVGGKGGADDLDVFVAVLGELLEGLVGVGLEPGFASKPGLKGDAVFIGGKSRGLDEFFNGHGALVAIAGGVRGVAGVATVGSCEAVLMRGITFDEMALRDAVKGKEQLIEIFFFECGSCGFYQCFNVARLLVIGRKEGGLEPGRMFAYSLHEVNHRGLIAGHRVVWVHGNDKAIIDALVEEFEKGVFSGGVAVAHAEFSGESGALGKGGLLCARCQDKGRALGFPNAGIGLGGLAGALG